MAPGEAVIIIVGAVTILIGFQGRVMRLNVFKRASNAFSGFRGIIRR